MGYRKGWAAAAIGCAMAGAWLAAAPASAGVECAGRPATIVGTAGDDILIGTSRADVIVGRGGNDRIEGFGGQDVICGGAGDDTIFGGSGADTIYGQSGADTIHGGAGNDRVYGGWGADVLAGQSGRDTLYGEAGDDAIAGGGDGDRLWGGPGNDVVRGGPGDDLLTGDDGDDHLSGESGEDEISGSEGDDHLIGGRDRDSCRGDAGIDEAVSCENPDSTEIGDRPPILTRPSAEAVALTFDDGPSAVYTPIVLDILAEYDVVATFFVTGTNAKRYPQLIERMIDEGHSVQNHTCGHAWLTRYDNRGVIEQIECHNDIIEEITRIRPRCVRPPFGAVNDRVRSVIADLGMKTVMWDVDPWDFQRPGSSITAARVLRATGPGDVVLLHDTVGYSTYNALHTIIPELRRRGYTFETICD